MHNCRNYPYFMPGEHAVSLVDHNGHVSPGSTVQVVKPWRGTLYAIEMPGGHLHRWFAWFELKAENINLIYPAKPGTSATVVSSNGHGDPPHVEIGTRVRIVRGMSNIHFYDTILEGGEYHRWFADFEMVKTIK